MMFNGTCIEMSSGCGRSKHHTVALPDLLGHCNLVFSVRAWCCLPLSSLYGVIKASEVGLGSIQIGIPSY